MTIIIIITIGFFKNLIVIFPSNLFFTVKINYNKLMLILTAFFYKMRWHKAELATIFCPFQ